MNRSSRLVRVSALSCLPLLAVMGCGRQPVPLAQVPLRPALAMARLHSQSVPAEAPAVQQFRIPAIPVWARAHTFCDVSVPHTQRVAALTFDDGPWPGSTRKILAILSHYNVHATFFMLGQQVSTMPDIARAVRDQGHAIGNHSWSHPARTHDAEGEVARTDAAIRRVLGVTPVLFRPPYGLLTNGLAGCAKRHGETVLLWSADTRDWARPGSDRIVSRALRQIGPGGIVLMHDGGGNRRQTVAALPRIIEGLQARGYRLVTIPELLTMGSVPVQATKPASTHAQRPGHGSPVN